MTTTSKPVLKKIEGIVRNAVERRFKGEFTFDPIIAIAKPDYWGDERVHVYVVYKGDNRIVDPSFAVGLVNTILDNVTEEEVPAIPFKFFIEESEWDEFRREQVEPWIPAA